MDMNAWSDMVDFCSNFAIVGAGTPLIADSAFLVRPFSSLRFFRSHASAAATSLGESGLYSYNKGI